MKLYYVPMTRAGRVRWMLEELEVPYELARLNPSKGENRTPEYLAIHPLGHVPAFVDGDVKLFESGAIIAYLADKYPDKGLAPPLGSRERGPYYQWMFFAQATMEPPLADVFQHVVRLPDDQKDARSVERAKQRWAEVAAVVDRALADGRPYLLGDRFSAADIMVTSGLMWAKAQGMLEGAERLTEYSKRCGGRPAAKRARAD